MPELNNIKTILIVDDEERLRKALSRSLCLEGSRTMTAASGDEAMELFKEYVIDLVITDLVMPGMEYEDLLKGIRKVSPSTKIIIITAYSSEESIQTATELGVSHYIEKPFDLSKLRSLVAELLTAVEPEPRPLKKAIALFTKPTIWRAALKGKPKKAKKPKAFRPLSPRSVAMKLGKGVGAVSQLLSKFKGKKKNNPKRRANNPRSKRNNPGLPFLSPRSTMFHLGKGAGALSRVASVFTRWKAKCTACALPDNSTNGHNGSLDTNI